MIIKIKVFPNSPEERIEDLDGSLNIYVKARAENNKANLAVIKLLSKYYKKSVKEIRLKALSSRVKYAEVI